MSDKLMYIQLYYNYFGGGYNTHPPKLKSYKDKTNPIKRPKNIFGKQLILTWNEKKTRYVPLEAYMNIRGLSTDKSQGTINPGIADSQLKLTLFRLKITVVSLFMVTQIQ